MMAGTYFGITDIGKKRSNNEDSFIAEVLPGNHLIVACVIDGVGGYEGGEIAAQFAHDTILEVLKQPLLDNITAIKESLKAANRAIYNEKVATKTNEDMACVLTLALVDVVNNKFYYGHVGDTRLYLLRDHSLVKISHDQSFVGFLEDSGKLNEQEAMNHPKRNEINRALGFDKEISVENYVEIGESPFLPDDVLMLCSDGLTDMIDRHTITSVLTTEKDLEAKGKSLIAHANDAGGKDNITVVLVHNDKEVTKHTASKPAAKNISMENEYQKINPENESQTAKTVVSEKPKKSGITGLFTFLFVLIFIAFGWVVYKYYYNRNQHKNEVPDVAIRVRNEQEQLLLDSIAHTRTNEVFVLNQAGNAAIVVTDTIKITNDTLHIMGNGATLVADTFYEGPAFILSSKCKRIILDSLTLQNFDIGVIANSKGLLLRNVQFKNCRVPVQSQLLFNSDSVISGRIADTIFQKFDF